MGDQVSLGSVFLLERDNWVPWNMYRRVGVVKLPMGEKCHGHRTIQTNNTFIGRPSMLRSCSFALSV